MIRVALAMLTHDKAKYIALVAGIAFASLLISQQSAIFWSAIRSSTYGVRSASAADIWVMKPNVEILDLADPMREGVVNQVRSVEGVHWAVPYYQALGMVRTRQGSFRPVLMIGVDDSTLIGAPSARMVMGDVRALDQPNAVIFDVSGYQQNFPDLPVEIGVEVLNVLDARWREVQFATTSRLRGEAAPVEQIHFVPGWPLTILGRASVFLPE